MRHPVDTLLLHEIRVHGLRFTCPDCLYLLADGRCAHFWPNEDHRQAPDAVDTVIDRKIVVFCKEFDLR